MSLNRPPEYKTFLTTARTIAHSGQDYVEWHGGIEEYGFWAIGVDDDSWYQAFESARVHLASYLYPGYQRAPHITIVPCGLLDVNHFSESHLQTQTATLVQAKIKAFSLQTGPLNSFTSVPYISIVDASSSLGTIRALLQQTKREDNVGKYVPHLTLGHYREAFETAMVVDHLQTYTPIPTKPLVVEELIFCGYKTKESQGPFEIFERVKLGS